MSNEEEAAILKVVAIAIMIIWFLITMIFPSGHP